MKISARNQLKGVVKSILTGSVMAEIVVQLPNDQEIVSVITLSSVRELNLKVGDPVAAIVKSTEVMIGKE